MVPYDDDDSSKHSVRKTGTNYCFSIKDPQPEDAGFYQVDVEEVNVLTTDFQGKAFLLYFIPKLIVLTRPITTSVYLSFLVPAVDFTVKLKDVMAVKGENAIFQCVLSIPLNRITWSTRDLSIDHGDKYEISNSEDKCIHTLRVKNCDIKDNGAYYAIAGITSSTASLTVEGGASFYTKNHV